MFCANRYLSVQFTKFHTSANVYRLPPKHQKKYKRTKHIPPFHKVPYAFDAIEDSVEVDKFSFRNKQPDSRHVEVLPPDNYSNFPLDRRINAWKWFDMENRVNVAPNVEAKCQILTEIEHNMWFHRISLPFNKLDILHFAQFISGTALLNSSNHDSSINLGTNVHNFDEKELQILLDRLFQVHRMSPQRPSNLKIIDIMETIHRFASQIDHKLKSTEVDSPSRIEAFFKRADYDEIEVREFDETVQDKDGLLRYHLAADLIWQIRSREQPLPYVALKDCNKEWRNFVPQSGYHPEFYDISPPDDAWSFISHQWKPHYHAAMHKKQPVRSLAGAWSRSAFDIGTPCQFGRLGVYDVTKDLIPSVKNLIDEMRDSDDGVELERRHWLAHGILAGFTWASAQALNQGLTYFNKLPAPFAAPMLLTDGGNRWQLLPFQLNSLRGLWWPKETNEPANLAFELQKPKELFSGTDIDVDVVKMLLQAVLRPTRTLEDCRELRCHLPNEQEVAANEVKKFINLVGEEPVSEARVSPTDDQKTLLTRQMSLPNEMYLNRQIDDRDLLEDLRRELPHLPGLHQMPQEFAKKRDLRMRMKRYFIGRNKTPRLPHNYE